MKCPSRGAAELSHDTRDVAYTYKSELATIPAVTGNFLPCVWRNRFEPRTWRPLQRVAGAVSAPS